MTTREERRRAEVAGRRARRRRRPSRRPIVIAAVVVATVAVLAGAVLTRDGEQNAATARQPTVADRLGSRIVKGAGPVGVEREASAFHIVYRLEENGASGTALSTDEVWVRRPFHSRTVTRRGAPPGGEQSSLEVGTFGRRTTQAGAARELTLEVLPVTAPADIRVASLLERAVRDGLVRRREVRDVAGRRCQVYRSAGQFGEGELLPPTDSNKADTCIDASGLMLEEVLYRIDGTTLSRRVATSVEEDIPLAEELFPELPRTVEPAQGGGLVQRVVDGTSVPGEFLEVGSPPQGFTYRGRFSVVPPQPENFVPNDPAAEGRRRASMADVWVKGADYVVVDQGGTLRGSDPFVVDPARPTADLGELGRAEIVLSGRGTSLRLLRGGGRYLTISGTIDADALAGIGRSIRKVEGTPLQFAS